MRGGSGTPRAVPIRARSATQPSRSGWLRGLAPKREWACRKLSASAMCTQVSRCGSEAAYGRPSGAVPVTRSWIARTLIRMPGHRRHGQGVQRLQQQGADPADEHRRIPVHSPDRPVFSEHALAWRLDQMAALRAPRPGHPFEDRRADTPANAPGPAMSFIIAGRSIGPARLAPEARQVRRPSESRSLAGRRGRGRRPEPLLCRKPTALPRAARLRGPAMPRRPGGSPAERARSACAHRRP